MNLKQQRSFRKAAFAAVLFVLAFAVTGAAQAQTYSVMYNFPGGSGASNPSDRAIAQGQDGNLYSTSTQGGTDYGTMFSITPSGNFTVLTDVSYFPVSGLTLGSDGNFYGTNQNGGPGGNCGFGGCGQVYQVTPAGVETVLYNFTGYADGSDPQAPPIEGLDGNYYGTTVNENGGAYGTVYKITPGGALTTIYTFNVTDGNAPTAPLLLGNDGNFYGVASQGGTGGDGVIFKMTPGGVLTVLHNFTGAPDGATPNYALIQAADGNFYGTTTGGGSFYGTIFKLTASGSYSILHTFGSNPDGAAPASSLMQATDGNLYGVANSGGTSGLGTIYSISTSGENFTVLYTFDGTTGEYPSSPLRQLTNGILYSDTYNGGTNDNGCNCGVFYSLDMGLGPFVTLTPNAAAVGKQIGILGQGFTGSSVVKFGGVKATQISVASSTFITATVPLGAPVATVTVTTGSTTLTSNGKFHVLDGIGSPLP